MKISRFAFFVLLFSQVLLTANQITQVEESTDVNQLLACKDCE